MFTTRKTIAIEPVLPRLSVARPGHLASAHAGISSPRRPVVVSACHRVRDNLVLRVVAKKNIVCLAEGEAEDVRRHG